MLSKKAKVRNVRNVLESPFQVLWSENTTEETSTIQDLLRELLPCAKLKETAHRCKTEPNRKAKDGEIKKREDNIYRTFLAPGFQSVLRGLEKKDLCCCIISSDIKPALIQKVVLTYAQTSQTPVAIIPDLKSITKTALGFATMVLGVKNIVAESPENKFFPIYKMVSLTPAYIETSIVPRAKGRLVTEKHSYSAKHTNVPKEIKVKYLYRENTNERIFIPESRLEQNYHPYSKVQKLEEFISFEGKQQAGKTILEDKLSKEDRVQYQYGSDDVDDVDSEDDEKMFFIDNKPDERLLNSSKEMPSSSTGNKIFINKSKSYLNRPGGDYSSVHATSMLWPTLVCCAFLVCTVQFGYALRFPGRPLQRVKRQQQGTTDESTTKKEESFETELCKDKDAGEWFRLVAGEGDNCRDVIQCTSSGLQAIRCPAGLYFDIEKQTCDWKDSVKNCKLKNKERKVKPLLYTDEPLCQDGFLACGDGACIERGLFCNGEKDCTDGSDENTCDNDNDPNRAPPCDPAVCVLPDCFCSEDGTAIPGDLPYKDVPQMITITFDDAINNNNIELYKEMFNGKRKNPNGCDIKATFFVSHKYTNYSAVQEVHRKGHEIAVHSITHNDEEQFWSNATVDDWAKEMAGMRVIAEKYANLTDNSVVGVRAPYLRVGGNNQFTMMEEQAFLYDSTITAPLSNPPLWPYTMYFRMPHRCHGNLQHCPTRSHAVWEMVMNELDRREDPNFDEYLPGCAMVDSCSNILTGDQFYNFLNHNFDRHYDQNRAPLGLYFHAAWLKNNPEFLDAFLYWIDEVLEKYNDVYFVTMTQVIQWIQNPRTVSEVKNFEPWREKCAVEGIPACWVPHSCKLTSKEVPGETINLQTCVRCPNNYPWINDPTGDGFF